jgi:hypothetical protein
MCNVKYPVLGVWLGCKEAAAVREERIVDTNKASKSKLLELLITYHIWQL